MSTIKPSKIPGRTSAALILLALIAACGPTGYTSDAYSDRPMGNDEYAITVTGNSQTTRERVADIALLRAAYLATEQKRSHFTILNKSSQQLSGESVVMAPVLSVPVPTPYSFPHAVLLIRLLPNDQPLPPNAVDAARVIAQVGARLR